MPDTSSDLPIITLILLATVVPWFMLAFFGIGPVRMAEDMDPGQITEGVSGPLSHPLANGHDVSSTSVVEEPVMFTSGTDAGDVGVMRPVHAG